MPQLSPWAGPWAAALGCSGVQGPGARGWCCGEPTIMPTSERDCGGSCRMARLTAGNMGMPFKHVLTCYGQKEKSSSQCEKC